MRMKKIFSVMMVVIMLLGTVATCLPLVTVHVHAVNATAVTLTATDGVQTTLTEDAEAATYSWVAETATLTLNGYSGRMISTNGNINLHLKGTNTLTMDAEATEETLSALNLDNTAGSAQITADVGGRLDIKGEGLKSHFSVITGYVALVNGTIDIDVDTSSQGALYVFERGVGFPYSGEAYDNAPSKDAVINLNVERTVNANSFVYAFYNGARVEYRGDVTINATVAGSDNDTVYGFSELSVYNASPKITMTVTNGEGPLSNRRAMDGCQGISLTEGGRIELNGRVRAYSLPTSANVNTVTTTPADNKYIWIDNDGTPLYANEFVLSDLDGNPCQKTVFEYSETPAELDWVGENHLAIPPTTVDDSVAIELLAGVRGASYYGAGFYAWKFEIIDGNLPEGLTIGNGGLIAGKLNAPCEAGSVTVRITDKNQSLYDESDDRSIDVIIPYGACVDKDRFLTVGDSAPAEMKSDAAGEGWSYDAQSKTLTLNGYHGGPISTEHYLNLHLDGENTITLTDEKTTGLLAMGSAADITVTAEEDGVLNIVSDSLTKQFQAIESALYVKNGTINIDVSSSFENGGEGYAIRGYLEFVKDITEPAVWNVKLTDTSVSGSAYLRGNGNNGVSISERDSLTYTVDLKGKENTKLTGLYSLNLYNSSANITVTVDNNGGSGECVALDGVNSLVLKEGGFVDLTGTVKTYSLPSGVSPHTVTTIPANDAYIWYDTNDHYYYESFVMQDLDGTPVTHAVFEYSEEPAELKWVGDDFISFPGGAVGEYIGTNLWAAIRGAHVYNWGADYWNFEIIEGQLPPGVYINSYNGKFGAGVTAPCVAGTVKIRATDLAGTRYDESDDRSIEFEIPYGAYITNKPVSGLSLDKDEIVLDYEGTGDITATVTPNDAAYPYVTGKLVGGNAEVSVSNISEPIEGVSVLTLKAWQQAGKYTVEIKTVELGLTESVTVYVREATPKVNVSLIDEKLVGFIQGNKYQITGENVTPFEFTAESSAIKIVEEWVGKTIHIVMLNESEEKCNSNPKSLDVPARPAAPEGVAKTDASDASEANGSITNVNNTMQYQKEGSSGWLYINDTCVSGLGIGTYYVRYASTYDALASQATMIVIGYGELTLTDEDAFDIPGGQTDTTAVVDLGAAVSGGKKPYVWAIEGPAWISIDQNGKVTAVRPDTEQDATTATVTVTDGDEISKSITINVGAVSLPHVCVFDKERIEDIYKVSDADCISKAIYHYSCECGAIGDERFTYGEANGHNYTEKIEDAEHLKLAGADCQTKNVYWYDCSICAANARDNPKASEMYYEGTAVGDHLYGELIGATQATHTQTELIAGIAAHYRCSACDGYFTEEKKATLPEALKGELPAHSYGEWINTDHEKHWKECSCGLKAEEDWHDYDDENDMICNVCEFDRTPPHVHMGVKQTGKAATCTENGWNDYYICACDKLYTEADCINEITDFEAWKIGNGKIAAAHDLGSLIQETPAVHSKGEIKAGMKAHYQCSVCQSYFDENGDETTVEVLVIPAPDHAYGVEWESDASEHWHECECGDKVSKTIHTDDNDDGKCDACEYPMSNTSSTTELPGESDPIESDPIESDPIESDPIESDPIESDPIESDPIESDPIESDPIESDPIESDPIESDPIESESNGDESDENDSVENGSGLGTGAIVGIAIGSAAVVGIGGFSVFWFVIKKKTWAELLAIFKKS